MRAPEQRKKTMKRTPKHRCHENIETFLLKRLHFKFFTPCISKECLVALRSHSSHPQPFVPGCASGEVHPTLHQAPGLCTWPASWAAWPVVPCGGPGRAQKLLGTVVDKVAPVPLLSPHAPTVAACSGHTNLCTDP